MAPTTQKQMSSLIIAYENPNFGPHLAILKPIELMYLPQYQKPEIQCLHINLVCKKINLLQK
jgi:hypothetical protein